MLTLVALFPGESYRFPMLMAVIGVTGWTGYARYVRAEFLRLRTADFVHAAVAAGLPTPAVIFRHMLPNGVTPVVITASFSVAGAVIAESTLSYLGLGTVDQPSWGGLLAQSLGQGGQFLWWLARLPRDRYLPDRAGVQPARRGASRRPGPQADVNGPCGR